MLFPDPGALLINFLNYKYHNLYLKSMTFLLFAAKLLLFLNDMTLACSNALRKD